MHRLLFYFDIHISIIAHSEIMSRGILSPLHFATHLWRLQLKESVYFVKSFDIILIEVYKKFKNVIKCHKPIISLIICFYLTYLLCCYENLEVSLSLFVVFHNYIWKLTSDWRYFSQSLWEPHLTTVEVNRAVVNSSISFLRTIFRPSTIAFIIDCISLESFSLD